MAQVHPLFENPDFRKDLEDRSLTPTEVSTKWQYSRSSVTTWRQKLDAGLELPPAFSDVVEEVPGGESENHNADGSSSYVRFSETAWGYDDYLTFIAESGMDPERVTFTWGWTSNPGGGFWNKLNNVRSIDGPTAGGGPEWPVITPGPTFVVPPIQKVAKISVWKTAILMADTQVGYRILEDGTLEPFHDEAAIDVALQIVNLEQPDQVVVMGDIIDLAAQGKYTQEQGFARSTQPAIDRTTLLGAQLRSATDGQIVYIEGNHDRRLQNFVEANALAAFGLRRGGLPDEWPVMSLPNLLRLDEYNIVYKDAYPTSHWWINDKLRCEHGTRSNSSGSTASQYMNETPHISRAHGHSHRLEVQSKTTYDRLGKIRSMAINPGCLCRVDGAVPSVKSAVGADGKTAQVAEDWQQGIVVIRYREGDEFFVDGLIQIDDGRTVYQNQEFTAS